MPKSPQLAQGIPPPPAVNQDPPQQSNPFAKPPKRFDTRLGFNFYDLR